MFGTVNADTAGAVMRNWEQIKKEEKGRTSLMDGIAGDLPSLLYAHKVQRKAASVGLDTVEPLDQRWARVSDGSPPTHAEVGELLFAVVGLAREADVDPEAALRGVSGAFRRRFEGLERLAAERGVDIGAAPADEVSALWIEAGGAQPP